MDTIDVSNLNRQFLFRKKHVRQPKSIVARESALQICPDANIVAYHENVKDPKFGPEFIKQFDVVLNALDNLDARRHMNRVCLAAGVPLIESGSAGYLGQVQVIFGGETECFECQPKATPTQYPYCTIHATPSKSIHNIIWAKEALFKQLFGPPVDGDDDDDETAVAARKQEVPEALVEEARQEERISFGRAQFFKAFHENIYRLLKLDALWEKRAKPICLRFEELLRQNEAPSTQQAALLADQRIWSMKENASMFVEACNKLYERKLKHGSVGWDKDDDDALNFVTAASNLRGHCYGIEILSRFDVKQKAGNIIPAIASTNAIVAGLIVLEAFKVIDGRKQDCRFTYVYKEANPGGKVLNSLKLDQRNPSCYVCSHAFVHLEANVKKLTLGDFKTEVLIGRLGMVSPSIVFGTKCLYESPMEADDEDEMAGQLTKTFGQVDVTNGCILEVSDQCSQVSLSIAVVDKDRIVEVDKETQKENELKWRIAQEGSAPAAPAAPQEPPVKRGKVDHEDEVILL